MTEEAKKSNTLRIKNWYTKNEHRISLGMLVLGFILDSLLLDQVDALRDIIVLTMYIALSGLCILILSINESDENGSIKNAKTHFWLSLVLQFILGGLFSAFVVFYVRSATLETSWPFLLLLLLYFFGNEFLKQYYLQLSFRLSVYFFALLAYFIVIVPTFTKTISSLTFVLSTIISILVFSLFFWILSLYKKETMNKNRKLRIAYYVLILATVNIFYFTNVIPPLPLTLRDAGVFHHMIPIGNGGYTVKTETLPQWFDFLQSPAVFHRYNNEPVYVYTAVYSPIDLNISIIHNWQKYNTSNKKWETVGNVTVPIRGGRQDGYRLYSFRTNIDTGLWRVNVITPNNHLVGRVKFEVVNSGTEYPLLEIIK